ncbi:hypothetical protein BDY17DRAFT_312850 [Neohortaea acidophila]|uniref:Pentatricopeptide repeat protein n=1 Tax=Neohortaea acidophila TaxID=245834 RepID=A0A6A6PKY2_9PEZI|nr:uncharacterized protein BDY17DRAFT_312850 [Neohortaea acidophila]KAF2479927.1 hypothetical protein BDY17DRAFT_312850 [Neohortaea acidophila]
MGMKPNIQICNIIMLNAIEAGDRSTALSVYRSLVQRELKPDEFTFAILLKACKMNIDDAELLNQIIRDAIESVNLRKAEVVAFEILYCLILHHTKHNRRTALATVTDACAQLFDLQPLEKLGLPIPKRQQQQSDRIMPLWPPAANLLITMSIEHVLSSQSDVEAVAALYVRWRELVDAGDPCLSHLATDDYTANIFLMAFIKHSNGLLHASRVIRDMQRPLPPSARVTQCKPTVQSWSIFLHGFTRHGKPKLAEQILAYMRGQGIEPNHVTWSTLLTGYARAQDEEGVLEGLRQVHESGFVWEEWMEGATKSLKQKARVEEELQKAKLVKRLNFMEELKRELEGRLSAAADVAQEDSYRSS